MNIHTITASILPALQPHQIVSRSIQHQSTNTALRGWRWDNFVSGDGHEIMGTR